MKAKSYILLSVVLSLILCSFSTDIGYYGGYDRTPILMKRSDFEAAIKTLPAQELEKTTRINLKGDLIYVVELYKGVHVINNVDSMNPDVNYHFINIPGCVDMTIKGNVLFARSAEDLVAIDITDVANVKELSRVRETFPELQRYEYDYYMPTQYTKGVRTANTVIIDWEEYEENN